MRVAAVALSMLGALVSLYVAFAAYQNYPTVDSKSFFTFFAIGGAFALLGAAGGLFTWRGRKFGSGLLLLETIGGRVAWPWLAAAIVYLLATALSIVSLRMAPRATGRIAS